MQIKKQGGRHKGPSLFKSRPTAFCDVFQTLLNQLMEDTNETYSSILWSK